MEQIKDIDRWIRTFCDRVSGLEIEGPRRFRVAELSGRKPKEFDGWERRSGVYFFERAGVVEYVGRAMWSVGLIRRIHDQCRSLQEDKWASVIQSPDTTIGIVAFEEADWYWSAALEPFLISHCTPYFNRRVC